MSTTTRIVAPKATVEQTHLLGQYFGERNYNPQQTLDYLKGVNYTYEGYKYSGSSVANVVAGYWAGKNAQAQAVEPRVSGLTLAQVEQLFQAGELKFTKTKGLHNPKEL